jgi:hypothetical protein
VVAKSVQRGVTCCLGFMKWFLATLHEKTWRPKIGARISAGVIIYFAALGWLFRGYVYWCMYSTSTVVIGRGGLIQRSRGRIKAPNCTWSSQSGSQSTKSFVHCRGLLTTCQ